MAIEPASRSDPIRAIIRCAMATTEIWFSEEMCGVIQFLWTHMFPPSKFTINCQGRRVIAWTKGHEVVQRWQCNPTQRMSGTGGVAAILLGTSESSTLQQWPCPVGLLFVWEPEATLARSPVPQQWQSGNRCFWMPENSTARLLSWRNL